MNAALDDEIAGLSQDQGRLFAGLLIARVEGEAVGLDERVMYGALVAIDEGDRIAPPFVFSSGHRIDVGRAIDMHPQAKKLLADETTALGLRRTMVKTAVIMGFPVEG